MRRAEGEIAVACEDVWRVLAEPYHLGDWWPGVVGVQPDRRGLATGARWTVRLRTWNLLTGRGERETMVLVREVVQGERLAFHLLLGSSDVEVQLRHLGPLRTGVTIQASGRRAPVENALERLRDLCETQ